MVTLKVIAVGVADGVGVGVGVGVGLGLGVGIKVGVGDGVAWRTKTTRLFWMAKRSGMYWPM